MAERYEDIQTEFPEVCGVWYCPTSSIGSLIALRWCSLLLLPDEDAYAIFETMNDRGKPLSAADMMKGYLLSQIGDSLSREAANRLWRQRALELRSIGGEKESRRRFRIHQGLVTSSLRRNDPGARSWRGELRFRAYRWPLQQVG